jgi:predicted acylesterase/phospholipase RssA
MEIADSIKTFKPSKSLAMLTSKKYDDDEGPGKSNKPTAQVDVVISGGGMKGYFVCGCAAVLQRQLQTHNIEIARVAGASAGAWSAFFICTGVTTAMWIESYHKLLESPDRTIHEIYAEDMVIYCLLRI